MKRLLVLAAVAALITFPLVASADPVTESVAAPATLVVFCVRHAEKAEGSDPVLTEAGTKRAAALATMLRDAGVKHVHSTDYKRTMLTAAPVAKKLDLETAKYDPREMRGLVEAMKKTGGRHLVVGHSNTTPYLVKALGGDDGDPISEMEYDRLYMVTIAGDQVSTVVLRF